MTARIQTIHAPHPAEPYTPPWLGLISPVALEQWSRLDAPPLSHIPLSELSVTSRALGWWNNSDIAVSRGGAIVSVYLLWFDE